MNRLTNIKEISQVAQQMSKEMMKAGLIAEMQQEAFEGIEEDDLEQVIICKLLLSSALIPGFVLFYTCVSSRKLRRKLTRYCTK